MTLVELLKHFRSVEWLKVDFDISGPQVLYCLECDHMKKLVVKNRLKEIREASGKTQETLANLSGTTVHTIESIEKDIYCPSLYLALCIAFVMHKSVEDIFYLDIKVVSDPQEPITKIGKFLKGWYDAL